MCKTHSKVTYKTAKIFSSPQAPWIIISLIRQVGSNKRKIQIKYTIQNKCVSKTDTNPPFAFQIAFPRGTDFTVFLQGGSKSRDLQSEISIHICRAQTCAHSGIEPSTLAKVFLQDGPKVRQKFEFLSISSLYIPYISVTAKNRGLQAAYVAF